jgi:polyhydroxybutyrate depolymerase
MVPVKRILAVLAVPLLLVSLVGCTRDPYPSGTTAQTIRVGGVERDYLLTVPNTALRDAPLVVVMHGGLGSAEQARDAYGWDQLAAKEGFIVAYPDGLGRAWNEGDGCCGASGENGVDDVRFLEQMIAEIGQRAPIDEDRVYATGMSNGAMMSYRLACDSDVLAAVAAVAGTILGECDEPEPLSVLAIHGDADESVRMDGEPGSGIESIDGMPIADVNQYWREVDGCEAPENVLGDVSTSTASCGRMAVELVVVAGAGHQWPGSTQSKGQKALGAVEPSTAIDATTLIWQFFDGRSRA